MAEELRFFLRTAIWVIGLAVVYWFVSHEPAGTALLVILGLALAAFLAVAIAFEPRTVDDLQPSGRGPIRRSLDGLNRLIGFHERADDSEPAPLAGGPDLVPLASPWPIVAAAAMVIVGLGLIFGVWLLIPGIGLLILAGIGWLTQLDRA